MKKNRGYYANCMQMFKMYRGNVVHPNVSTSVCTRGDRLLLSSYYYHYRRSFIKRYVDLLQCLGACMYT